MPLSFSCKTISSSINCIAIQIPHRQTLDFTQNNPEFKRLGLPHGNGGIRVTDATHTCNLPSSTSTSIGHLSIQFPENLAETLSWIHKIKHDKRSIPIVNGLNDNELHWKISLSSPNAFLGTKIWKILSILTNPSNQYKVV